MTTNEPTVSNEILLDRAKETNMMLFFIIQKFIDKAFENATHRTTITWSALKELADIIIKVNKSLDQIKY